MSRYAYLVCPESREYISLGKAIFSADDSGHVTHFHIGHGSGPRNSQRDLLNQAIWKFFAEHVGKSISVVLEEMLDKLEPPEGFREIGGDTDDDVSLTDYLKGFTG